MSNIATATSRVLKYGFLGFLRNGFVSLATVLVMTIALFMIAGSVYADAALRSVLNTLKDQVDINIYFTPGVDEKDIIKLKEELEKMPEVDEVQYVSSEEVLNNFKERHNTDALTLQSLNELGENPFGAMISVKAKDPSQYESIAKFLNSKTEILNKESKIIDKVNFNDSKKAIETLSSIIKTSKKIALVLISFLIVVAVLIVFNTIRLAVYTNKEEISVMKLVGASDWYVQGPFIVEGILDGILSAMLTIAILYPLSVYLSEPSRNFLVAFDTLEYFNQHFLDILLLVLGVGIVLGMVSSYLSVRKYLDV